MRQNILLSLAAALGLFAPITARSQEKPEFESSYNENFLKRASLLNRQAPDLEIYDEQGNPYRLAQSRGKHTVVVFGCLT